MNAKQQYQVSHDVSANWLGLQKDQHAKLGSMQVLSGKLEQEVAHTPSMPVGTPWWTF